MVRGWINKVKDWLLINEKDLLLAFIIILVSIIGFALGRISAIKEFQYPISIEKQEMSPAEQKMGKEGGQIVGSKNGTSYHYSWCSGAARIKEENKIYFSSRDDAEKAGYRPAANCPGL
ncbi:hypothetical protein HYT00_01550 [Candidatus Giovannonibacteria bacterium]|nr:hypothetical protein [Candidatus Giovannonibacteria bacterium]